MYILNIKTIEVRNKHLQILPTFDLTLKSNPRPTTTTTAPPKQFKYSVIFIKLHI